MSKFTHLKAGLLSLLLIAGSAQARFVSTDPVQANQNNGQNFNRYNYANNNPYKFTDPDGRQSVPLSIPRPDIEATADNVRQRIGDARNAGAADQYSGRADVTLNNYANPSTIAKQIDSLPGDNAFEKARNLEKSPNRYVYTSQDGTVDLAHAYLSMAITQTTGIPGSGQYLGDVLNEGVGDMLIKGSSSAYRPEDTNGHMIGTLAAPLVGGNVTPGAALQGVIMDRGGQNIDQARESLREKK